MTTPEFYGAKRDGVTNDTVAFREYSKALKALGARPMQLTIDGREVSMSALNTRLTPAQRAILRRLMAQGQIRPVEAGQIMHAHRKHLTEVARRYRSSDGCAALHRLAERGIVRHISRGVWRPA